MTTGCAGKLQVAFYLWRSHSGRWRWSSRIFIGCISRWDHSVSMRTTFRDQTASPAFQAGLRVGDRLDLAGGHSRRCVMSALTPKADIGTQSWNVRFVPKADISSFPDADTRRDRVRMSVGSPRCLELLQQN